MCSFASCPTRPTYESDEPRSEEELAESWDDGSCENEEAGPPVGEEGDGRIDSGGTSVEMVRYVECE